MLLSLVTALGFLFVVNARDTVYVSVGFSVIAALMTGKTLPRLKQTFVNARLSGTDVLKPHRPTLYAT